MVLVMVDSLDAERLANPMGIYFGLRSILFKFSPFSGCARR